MEDYEEKIDEEGKACGVDSKTTGELIKVGKDIIKNAEEIGPTFRKPKVVEKSIGEAKKQLGEEDKKIELTEIVKEEEEKERE